MTDQIDNQLAEPLDYLFPAAQQEWDLVRFYQDLAKAKKIKGKGDEDLSPMEKLHLRGLLCGHSPTKIAKILGKKAKGLHVDLSKTLYPYLKDLLNKEDMENWRNFRKWAEEAGYKKTPSPLQLPQGATVFDISSINIEKISVEKFSIENICIEKVHFEENGVIIDVKFSLLVTPFSSKFPRKD